MHKRVLALPLAALVIAGLSAYKLTRTYDTPGAPAELPQQRPAPGFALFDHHKPPQPVRLESYLGRHEILLAFFDRHAGFGHDPTLRRLLSQRDELASSGLTVFGISTALPQENRQTIERLVEAGVLRPDEPLPYRLLSDVDYRVHQQWGCWDADAQRTRPAVFFIDRAGNVSWNEGVPRPVGHVDRLLDETLGEPSGQEP